MPDMELRPGTRLRSAVCDAQFVVVRAPQGDVDLRCGGVPLLPADQEGADDGAVIDPDHAGGALLGKRYADEDLGLELLCTKGGEGSLSCNGAALDLKGAKPLPASD
jgi:hypothetical protein